MRGVVDGHGVAQNETRGFSYVEYESIDAPPPAIFFLRSLQRYLRAEAITVGVERKLVVVRRTGSRRDQAGEVEAADTQSADIG
ncbi:MAG TPA: hypothetical protein VJK00_01700, partial [Steroidobacteraceae bacterium]|nr:hypothetical protein [Steroidobacteraceae bacterium]